MRLVSPEVFNHQSAMGGLYFFTEREAQQGDFDVLNHYISTSERSLFTKVRSGLCAMIAPVCAQPQHVQRIHL